MALKKVTSALIALVMLGFVMLPINAMASTIDNGGIEVCSGEAGTACHCGGIRQVTQVEDITSSPDCPEHGAACGNYYYVEVKDYYHCSNPYCTDTWYGAVRYTYYNHIY